ncbi:MAG: hypothetical protein IH859_09920, partial [Chloroflexi bacterium]|nr:hypothetical protein [Chloroflexota bacterium]
MTAGDDEQAEVAAHDLAQLGDNALAALRALAPANFNFDLMCGAPGIDPTAIVAEAERAAGFLPPHISLYWLEIEPGTLFGRNPAVRRWAEENKEALSET